MTGKHDISVWIPTAVNYSSWKHCNIAYLGMMYGEKTSEISE